MLVSWELISFDLKYSCRKLVNCIHHQQHGNNNIWLLECCPLSLLNLYFLVSAVRVVSILCTLSIGVGVGSLMACRLFAYIMAPVRALLQSYRLMSDCDSPMSPQVSKAWLVYIVILYNILYNKGHTIGPVNSLLIQNVFLIKT